MLQLDITFTFLSPWHAGSGFGEGAHLDALPVKTDTGLPYLPGRTVKGLFRDAVELAEGLGHFTGHEAAARYPQGVTVALFGSRDNDLSRYDSASGMLRFSSATLGDAMEVWALKTDEIGKQAIRQLYMPLAATSIDTNGIAETKTLRKIEVALPVTLTAAAEVEAEDHTVIGILRTAAALIRQAGAHRHRGLGRVAVEIKEVAR